MKTLVRESPGEVSERHPFRIPLARPSVGDEELTRVGDVLASGWLGSGRVADRFADAVAERTGAAHVVVVNSGTAALHCALAALGIGPGDEVIVPSLTFASTVQAVVAVGATPVFCEVRSETLNVDIDDLSRRITDRTRALLPVHYGGEPCDLPALLGLARNRGLRIVEDAAHAFGSRRGGQPIGSHGDIVCFSFDPIKNITCGLGGAAVTNDSRLARKLQSIANVGIDPDSIRRACPRPYAVASAGLRYRMSDINAAIGLVQLSRMDGFHARKVEIATRYNEALGDIESLALLQRAFPETFPFSYVLRVTDGSRDRLMEHLKAEGIGSAVQFTPNHLQPFFEPWRVSLPVTERLYGEVINLPFYSDMTEEDTAEVISVVRRFYRTI